MGEKHTGWQPIETAPRDGSWFVACNADCEGEFEVFQYAPYYWNSYKPVDGAEGLFIQERELVSEFAGSNFHRATHWLPLPATPTDTKPAGEGDAS